MAFLYFVPMLAILLPFVPLSPNLSLFLPP